jgi:Na+-driven multidrug efflux pump
MMALAGIGLLFVVFADAIVAGFTSDPAVAPIAVRGLRIISAGFPLFAYGYVMTQAFNGAGDAVTPTLINVFCLWLGEIPLAYGLARPMGWGPTGVYWSIFIAFSAMSLVSALLFRRGSWKLARV